METAEQKLTPLMRQYWDIKNQHQDKVLLFRMGDFYEMFYQDAIIAAPILNIALTSRNKKAQDETPMCGVPHHSIAGPIGKLLSAGYKVAICEQLEDPATVKGIVKRGVVRILSPGMVYDPDTLDELSANFMASFDQSSVSFLDASTGEALVYQVESPTEVQDLIALLRPIEVILTSEQRAELVDSLPKDVHISVADSCEKDWPSRFQKLPESALRLLTYAVSMQGPELISAIREFQYRRWNETMRLPGSVLKHLEVFQSYRNELKGSLFHSINRTKSSAGARLLKQWLQFPLLQIQEIQRRQNLVEKWSKDLLQLKQIRQSLSKMGDIERRLGKLANSSCHPRDLQALKDSLEIGMSISSSCDGLQDEDLQTAQTVIQLIHSSIVEEPPLQIKNGGYMARGYNMELDGLIDLAENSARLVLELEAREREATGISTLKVRFNNVFGFYIEVTNTHKGKAPKHYQRKQTLANAERFTTDELNELESKVLSAKSKRLDLEDALFQDVRRKVLQVASQLLRLAAGWSELDVVSSLAWLAIEQNYTKPQVTEAGELVLVSSRHPVVEQEVKKNFVPNTVRMQEGECILLTGPNMAGKSTLMRQVAVNVLLAQIGSFVPCAEAKIPAFQNIFTRIGASDFLSEGLSTFMVEMQEAAHILKNMGGRTLLVLDEIGRGTSTYDGMSLAQAILENICRVGSAYTLFATHYHELTTLPRQFPQVLNKHMAIREAGKQIEFLHCLQEGPANRSYGIHVAELAGLPASVLNRASELLRSFESAPKTTVHEQLQFITDSSHEDPRIQEFEKKLRAISTESMTPLEALNTLSRWQQDLS